MKVELPHHVLRARRKEKQVRKREGKRQRERQRAIERGEIASPPGTKATRLFDWGERKKAMAMRKQSTRPQFIDIKQFIAAARGDIPTAEPSPDQEMLDRVKSIRAWLREHSMPKRLRYLWYVLSAMKYLQSDGGDALAPAKEAIAAAHWSRMDGEPSLLDDFDAQIIQDGVSFQDEAA